MSIVALGWALRQTTGSPTCKAVLIALADRHHADTGECFPSVARMAEDTELSERTVKRALEQLVEQGVIGRSRRRRKNGSLGTYEYDLPVDSVSTPGATVAPSPGDTVAPRNGVDLPNEVTTTSVEVVVPGPPPAVLVDGRNRVMDAVAAECGVDQASPRYREVVAAVNGTRGRPGIRALAWRDLADTWDGTDLEGAIVQLVFQRSEQYRAAMSGALLTPTALAKWWVDLPKMRGRGGDALDAARVAEDELRRMGRIT